MGTDAWSLGSRDGDRWLWRRDDVARQFVTYAKDGAVESTRPYTAEENLFAEARVTRAMRSTAAATARRDLAGVVPGVATLPGLTARVARLEGIVANLLGGSDV